MDRLQKIKEINQEYNVLSAWENNFVDSLMMQVKKGRKLSPRQNDILQKVESKVSPQAIENTNLWKKSWDEEKKRIAKICANYYKHTPYFKAESQDILSDPNMVLSQKLYSKMCENKYAKKVIAEATKKPLFPVGSVAMLRETAGRNLSYSIFQACAGTPLFVMKILGEVKSAAKGAKQYELLPAGAAATIIVEERYLKKYRKSKKKVQKKLDNDIPF